MKILTFSIKTQQKADVESTYQGNLPFSDLPGFLRDCFLSALPSPKKTVHPKCEEEVHSFKIIVENNIFQLVYKDQKNKIEQQQTLKFNNMIINILSEDIVEKIEELISITESQEKQDKNIIYAMSKTMPKISSDYALMNDHFSASPMRDENVAILAPIGKYEDKNTSNGDILRDLGFTEPNETDLRKTIKYLDYSLDKEVTSKSRNIEINDLIKFW